MARYLLAATALPGHAAPLLAIGAQLRRQGHEVVFFSGSAFAVQAQRCGLAFVPFDAAIDHDHTQLDIQFPQWKTLPSAHAQLCFGLRHFFADAMPAQLAGIDRILDGFAADAVIADAMFGATLALLLRPGPRPPVVAVGISALALSSCDTAFFGTSLPPGAEPARNLAMNRNLQQALFGAVQQYFDAVLARLGVAPLPCFFLDALIRLPERYLQLTVPAFEYPRSDLPESVRFVGSLLAPASEDWQEPDWWPQLDDGRRVVVVTQGTLANQDLQQLIAPALAGLAARDDLQVIATTGGTDASSLTLPRNARVLPFVPYDRLLPKASVFVSNGGYGSVNHALRLGVPLVVAGNSEEKPEIAARVAWSGAGINLGTGTPSARQVGDAVARVLEQPGYRDNARRLSAEYARHDALATIAQELAGLARGRAGLSAPVDNFT